MMGRYQSAGMRGKFFEFVAQVAERQPRYRS